MQTSCLVNAPDLTKRIFTEIGALFEEGKLVPLPYRAFDFDEIGNAFRLMQNAGHIGKIVVLPPVAGRDDVAAAPARRMSVNSDGVHLVVGGIGGFGLAAANWLVKRAHATSRLHTPWHRRRRNAGCNQALGEQGRFDDRARL